MISYLTKHTSTLQRLLLPAFAAMVFAAPADTVAATVRDAVWAGAFYPAGKEELVRSIRGYAENAQQTEIRVPSEKSLKALILPHAGYIYSGPTAAHASLVLADKKFSKVILIGPDHRVGLSSPAVSGVDFYATPLGRIRLDPNAEKLRQNPYFTTSTASDRSEHSLEVILPFLQIYNGDFTLVPVVLGHCDTAKVSEALSPLLDQRTLLVASSDLSHFLPYDAAVATDRETINYILQLDASRLAGKSNCACGIYPIMILLDLAKRFGWQPYLLNYSNSGDTAGSKSNVVGYAAIAFYGENPMDQEGMVFDEDQGEALVKLARQTIAEKLGRNVSAEEKQSLSKILADKDFRTQCGTFVTLHIEGQLRGCIGSLTASDPVVEGVRKNALNAAFHDARFRPLGPEELDRIDIEVSVLTEPQTLDYKDGPDLLNKLRPGKDGVIIRQGFYSATFLPQVWKQLPSTEDFLTHLCRKAGLPGDSWRTGDLQVQTYQVQYFEEKK